MLNKLLLFGVFGKAFSAGQQTLYPVYATTLQEFCNQPEYFTITRTESALKTILPTTVKSTIQTSIGNMSVEDRYLENAYKSLFDERPISTTAATDISNQKSETVLSSTLQSSTPSANSSSASKSFHTRCVLITPLTTLTQTSIPATAIATTTAAVEDVLVTKACTVIPKFAFVTVVPTMSKRELMKENFKKRMAKFKQDMKRHWKKLMKKFKRNTSSNGMVISSGISVALNTPVSSSSSSTPTAICQDKTVTRTHYHTHIKTVDRVRTTSETVYLTQYRASTLTIYTGCTNSSIASSSTSTSAAAITTSANTSSIQSSTISSDDTVTKSYEDMLKSMVGNIKIADGEY